jgi:outer membrane protein assembly factor BamB
MDIGTRARTLRWAALAFLGIFYACSPGGSGGCGHHGTNSTGGGPTTATSADVLTWHNDLARTGQNLNETALTPATVSAATFAKKWTQPVDGQVYTQPLFKSNVTIAAVGVRNIVYVATQHDSVYALDSETGQIYWQDSFINPAAGITTVPSADVGSTDINPEIGITGTPVIDPASLTLYVVAKTKEVTGAGTSYVQRLHALDLATGAEKFGGPVVIQPTVAGTGDGNDGTGHIPFDPLIQNQRSALVLLGGIVYIAYSSHGDNGPYHGWLIGYNATTLAQTAVFNTGPNNPPGNAAQASIWMDGAAPASDGSNFFVITGNGWFDANSPLAPNTEYGDSFIRISTRGGQLTAADYFSPSNQAALSNADLDLGSGGVILLPDQTGAHTHIMVGGGKQGVIYVVDRDNLGGFNVVADQVVQEIDLSILLGNALPPIAPNTTPGPPGLFSTPAYFNGTIFYKPAAADFGVNVASPLLAFPVAGGTLGTTPVQSAATWGWPGSSPVISANGFSNGIVWALEADPSKSAVLHAFDASNIAVELYNSTLNPGDGLSNAVKFSSPTVAQGHVYVATQMDVSMFCPK